jgi:methylenetetrahydrofolate dehydrogenase (NADP+) / methenyltetrahydrofolate cyclohydrolase
VALAFIMPVVWIPATLRSFTTEDTVRVQGTTVREVIEALELRCPGIKQRLCDGDSLRPGLAVVIDNQVSRAGLWQPVGEASEIHFVPAIAGGGSGVRRLVAAFGSFGRAFWGARVSSQKSKSWDESQHSKAKGGDMATILDGKKLAETMQAEIAAEVERLVGEKNVRPGLAAVLVGDNPASQRYVRNKRKACEKAGLVSWLHQLPKETTQQELLALIARLNTDPQVHGILVQLPLPKQIEESAIIRAVAPHKDVDGFGPENLGLLATGNPRFLPCTPAGVQQLLIRNDIAVAGKHVVIVGRSNIVGKPLALILMQKAKGADATVTVCHSRTKDIGALTRQADIVVVAIGQTHFLKADMVRPGAVVIDVGINALPDGKLAGDVDFAQVERVASAITPVPGGVGPMTITMLLANTLQAARLV